MAAERLAELFLSGLSKTKVWPIPRIDVPPPAGPAIDLTDWRTSMLEARQTSLAKPGCYLDASPTGSGKTNFDLRILMQASLQEAA